MCFAVFDTRFKRKFVFIFSAVLITAGLAVLLSFCFSATSENTAEFVFDLKEIGGVGGFLSRFSLDYETTLNSRQVTLPGKNDEVFAEYDSLQEKIGLSILKFSGKRVEERYIKLKNKNSRNQTLYAVLYIYKDKVIGAHLTSLCEGSENLPLTAFV